MIKFLLNHGMSKEYFNCCGKPFGSTSSSCWRRKCCPRINGDISAQPEKRRFFSLLKHPPSHAWKLLLSQRENVCPLQKKKNLKLCEFWRVTPWEFSYLIWRSSWPCSTGWGPSGAWRWGCWPRCRSARGTRSPVGSCWAGSRRRRSWPPDTRAPPDTSPGTRTRTGSWWCSTCRPGNPRPSSFQKQCDLEITHKKLVLKKAYGNMETFSVRQNCYDSAIFCKFFLSLSHAVSLQLPVTIKKTFWRNFYAVILEKRQKSPGFYFQGGPSKDVTDHEMCSLSSTFFCCECMFKVRLATKITFHWSILHRWGFPSF